MILSNGFHFMYFFVDKNLLIYDFFNANHHYDHWIWHFIYVSGFIYMCIFFCVYHWIHIEIVSLLNYSIYSLVFLFFLFSFLSFPLCIDTIFSINFVVLWISHIYNIHTLFICWKQKSLVYMSNIVIVYIWILFVVEGNIKNKWKISI